MGLVSAVHQAATTGSCSVDAEILFYFCLPGVCGVPNTPAGAKIGRQLPTLFGGGGHTEQWLPVETWRNASQPHCTMWRTYAATHAHNRAHRAGALQLAVSCRSAWQVTVLLEPGIPHAPQPPPPKPDLMISQRACTLLRAPCPVIQ